MLNAQDNQQDAPQNGRENSTNRAMFVQTAERMHCGAFHDYPSTIPALT